MIEWLEVFQAVPEVVYNHERDQYLERVELEDEFRLLGDRGVVPKFLAFRVTKAFNTRAEYEDYLSYLDNICDNIVAVDFGTGRVFDVNFAFHTRQELSNQLHVRFKVFLATDSEGIGEILWGNEDILLGAEYVYLSGTVIE